MSYFVLKQSTLILTSCLFLILRSGVSKSIFGFMLSKLPHKPKLQNQSTVKETNNPKSRAWGNGHKGQSNIQQCRRILRPVQKEGSWEGRENLFKFFFSYNMLGLKKDYFIGFQTLKTVKIVRNLKDLIQSYFTGEKNKAQRLRDLLKDNRLVKDQDKSGTQFPGSSKILTDVVRTVRFLEWSNWLSFLRD